MEDNIKKNIVLATQKVIEKQNQLFQNEEILSDYIDKSQNIATEYVNLANLYEKESNQWMELVDMLTKVVKELQEIITAI